MADKAAGGSHHGPSFVEKMFWGALLIVGTLFLVIFGIRMVQVEFFGRTHLFDSFQGTSWNSTVGGQDCAKAERGNQMLSKPHPSAVRVRNPKTGKCSWYVP